jgi:putative restriction endonuclease
MLLKNTQDLFSIPAGDTVSKRNLYDLIQFSKVVGSDYWSGKDGIIGNTPQQGINWIGQPPQVNGVLIKTRPGSYIDDGWSGEERTNYHYSFKARKGEISSKEIANQVLVGQQQYCYPILLFTEKSNNWYFEGSFSVSELADKFVVLSRAPQTPLSPLPSSQDEQIFNEGKRRYVAHLMAERSWGVVEALKSTTSWLCDICNLDFSARYGVRYIEAHHKLALATYSASHAVRTEDLALLCPNCHKAVHIYMKKYDSGYNEIREILCAKAR